MSAAARPGIAELDAEHAFPEWTNKAMFVGYLTVAVITAVSADVERRWLFAVLLGLVVVPAAIATVRALPHVVYSAMVLVPLAILNWAPASAGLMDMDGPSQTSLLIATFLAGEVVATGSRGVAIGVVGVCFALPVGRWFNEDSFNALPIWLGAVVIGVTIGVILRRLIESMADLKAAQGELATKAATEERQRIAREVHDVIAHSMTVTMLHITAARLAVGRGDDGAATEALLEAERLGRESLSEIRQTVGLLRSEPDGGIEAPQPGAIDIVQLVDGFAAAGVDVRLVLDGGLDEVGGPAGLTAFRVVQESLANAVRHQPGSSTLVDVEVNGDLRVRVTSRGGQRHATAQNGPGNGLHGMRERVEALRGTFSAGPDGSDAWLVECLLPEVTP
jgi:signal transduction histidine kinase